MTKFHIVYGQVRFEWNKELQETTGYKMKEILHQCRERHGRLPRPGREVYVCKTKDERGLIWLYNRAGTYEVAVRFNPEKYPSGSKLL